MNDKLFNVEPQTRAVKFRFETYKLNRIAKKMLDTLAENGTFKIDPITPDKRSHKHVSEYWISIESSQPQAMIENDLDYEIQAMIPEVFPTNYLFAFGSDKLGYINSFNIFAQDPIDGGEEPLIFCAHKIKEVRSDGTTILPKQIK